MSRAKVRHYPSPAMSRTSTISKEASAAVPSRSGSTAGPRPEPEARPSGPSVRRPRPCRHGPRLLAYVAALLAHPGFERRFRDDLLRPGLRVPLTADPALFVEASALGARCRWLHCYGETLRRPRAGSPLRPAAPAARDCPADPAGRHHPGAPERCRTSSSTTPPPAPSTSARAAWRTSPRGCGLSGLRPPGPSPVVQLPPP